MGIFDDIINALTGGNPTKKIQKREFEDALKTLPLIHEREREYLKGIFANDLKDGKITEQELKRRILDLKHNHGDILDEKEVEQVKRKLYGELEDNSRRGL
jgi:hypothetical protein